MLETSGARSRVNKDLLSQRRNNPGTRTHLRHKAADLNRTQTRYRGGTTYIYLYIHTYTYIYIHIHTYTYIYIHIHTYTYIYIHIHTYTYIHIHTYIHTYIHTHTYIHIHTELPEDYVARYLCVHFKNLSLCRIISPALTLRPLP